MRETARVALRKSKQAHSASNSLRVFAFIYHPYLFRPGTPAGSSQESDHTRSIHVSHINAYMGVRTRKCQEQAWQDPGE